MCSDASRRIPRAGFSLVEGILSITVLALCAAAISSVYVMGLQVQATEIEQTEIVAVLRSRMEMLLSTPFDNLASGTATETRHGVAYTVTWTVGPADMNGDSVVDPRAKQVVVEAEGRSLATLVINRRFGGKL